MLMTWNDICADPALRDLPYKIETNRWGQIVMSPAKHWHSRRQSRIHELLSDLKDEGYLLVEAAVQTRQGVKVADVAWASDAFDQVHEHDETLTAAPELCVEVLSDSNSPEAMREKAALYFSHGAREVWTCDDDGRVCFYTAPFTEMEFSALFPGFPKQI